jgi:hypothetical protein
LPPVVTSEGSVNPLVDGIESVAAASAGGKTIADQKLVTAIHASPSWREGKNAIVVFGMRTITALHPNPNQVVLIVDANYGEEGVHSTTRYNHSSLLKTLEAGFGVPCVNHACDQNIE